MQDPVTPNDLIALREDISQYELLRGQVGRILQVFTRDEFEIEFLDTRGNTKAKVRLKKKQVTVLRDEATLDEVVARPGDGSTFNRVPQFVAHAIASTATATRTTAARAPLASAWTSGWAARSYSSTSVVLRGAAKLMQPYPQRTYLSLQRGFAAR